MSPELARRLDHNPTQRKRLRTLIVSDAPSQWQNPLFRSLAAQSDLSLLVVFGRTVLPTDSELGGRVPVWGQASSCEGFPFAVAPEPGGALVKYAVQTVLARDYDVLIIPGWGSQLARTFLSVVLAVGYARKRTIVHTDATDILSRPHRVVNVRTLALRTLAMAGLHCGVTGTAARKHLERVGINSAKMLVLPYVVDNDETARETRKWRQNRDRLRLEMAGVRNADSPIMLAILKFVAREGLGQLLQGFILAAHEHPDARLLIVGDGPERKSNEQLVQDHGCGKQVTFCGYQPYPELPRFYAVADWFIHLPLSEPWGLDVNQAAAAGLPLLCSEGVGAAQDLLEDGVNGFSAGRTIGDAVDAIQRAIKTPPQRRAEMAAASVRLSERVHHRQWVTALRSFADGSR